MPIIDKIISLTNKYEDYVIDIRRKIHQNPELSFKEFETSQLVISELEKLNLDITTEIAGTGVMGVLKGKEEGKVLLIRGDMDALPIKEELDLDFKSRNKGIMHACGHDVHTANLLGAARVLADLKDEFNGTIKFIFQPGEERGGGAKKMIDQEILSNPKVDAALAMHIMAIKQGKVLLSNNDITSYSDGFTIKVFGKGAHTAKPQDGVDAINIAGNIIVSLNSIISKHIDPRDAATFSIGKIKGGTSNNVVSNYVELTGMIRSTTEASRDTIRGKIESISKNVALTFGGSASFELREGYPSIINNRELTGIIRNGFKNNLQRLGKDISEDIELVTHKPLLTADDFGYISQRVPSTYYMVGTGAFAPIHSTKFYIDEKYIKLCTRTMVLAVMEYLK